MASGTAKRGSQAGMTLIEMMIALAILLIVASGLMGLAVVATVTTENQGHLATRTAEYAQDKMEQLMSLKFGDVSSDTISLNCVLYLVNTDCSAGAAGLAVGGSLDFSAPVDDYVDYLDNEGNPLGGGAVAPDEWFFMRVWEITNPGGDTTLKQITVSCRTRYQVGTMESGNLLASTVTSLKTQPF
jgi:prepilin-type N-terminal cleavage/methylation domain-containing protein